MLIQTAAELDALPHLSVVLADLEGRAAQKDTSYDPPRWWVTGQPTALDNEDMRAVLPLTVLYRPDQPPATVETATAKPNVEAVALALRNASRDRAGLSPTDRLPWSISADAGRADARAVLALLPGRTEAEVKAEALREMSQRFRLASDLSLGQRDEIAALYCEEIAMQIEREG